MTYTTTWARTALVRRRIPPHDRSAAVRRLQEASGLELPITDAAQLVDELESELARVQPILADRSLSVEDRVDEAMRAILAHPDVVTAPVDDALSAVAGMRLDFPTGGAPAMFGLDDRGWDLVMAERSEPRWYGLDPWPVPAWPDLDQPRTVVVEARRARPRLNPLRGLWRRLTRQAVA